MKRTPALAAVDSNSSGVPSESSSCFLTRLTFCVDRSHQQYKEQSPDKEGPAYHLTPRHPTHLQERECLAHALAAGRCQHLAEQRGWRVLGFGRVGQCVTQREGAVPSRPQHVDQL